MTAIKRLLAICLLVILFNIADAESVPAQAGFSFSKVIEDFIKFPLNITRTVLKLPLKIFHKLVEALLQIFRGLNDVGSGAASEVVSLIKQLIGQVVDVLVSVGVLQGKTTEDIINGIMGIVEKAITFFIHLETTISSTIVETISKITDTLDIKKLIQGYLNLPIVKQIAQLIKSIKQFITQNFEEQINDIRSSIKQQFDKHADFFQPIFDGISSRILILTNALQALVNGKLSECPGMIPGENTPTEGLQWQLNLWINQAKVYIFRILGFAGIANKFQDKVDGLETTPHTFTEGTTEAATLSENAPSQSTTTGLEKTTTAASEAITPEATTSRDNATESTTTDLKTTPPSLNDGTTTQATIPIDNAPQSATTETTPHSSGEGTTKEAAAPSDNAPSSTTTGTTTEAAAPSDNAPQSTTTGKTTLPPVMTTLAAATPSPPFRRAPL